MGLAGVVAADAMDSVVDVAASVVVEAVGGAVMAVVADLVAEVVVAEETAAAVEGAPLCCSLPAWAVFGWLTFRFWEPG